MNATPSPSLPPPSGPSVITGTHPNIKSEHDRMQMLLDQQTQRAEQAEATLRRVSEAVLTTPYLMLTQKLITLLELDGK